MKINFRLEWVSEPKISSKSFKSKDLFSAFSDYAARISRFIPCDILGKISPEKPPKTVRWICERAKQSKVLNSDELAKQLEHVLNSGAKTLEIVVGGADGFSPEELTALKADLKWSFGPLTLSHEIAALVAGEQIYRAFTILNHLPYHTGHEGK